MQLHEVNHPHMPGIVLGHADRHQNAAPHACHYRLNTHALPGYPVYTCRHCHHVWSPLPIARP